MISLLLTSLMSFAQASTPATATVSQMYLTCVKSCVAWAERPGQELNRCNAECARLYLKPVKAGFCETYEEPCDDDRREDNQP